MSVCLTEQEMTRVNLGRVCKLKEKKVEERQAWPRDGVLIIIRNAQTLEGALYVKILAKQR